MRNQLERAKDFREDVVSSLDNECDGVINIDDNDVKTMNWLIEQAEQLERIKKLSDIDNLTIGEFANGVLLLIDNKEKLIRNTRS